MLPFGATGTLLSLSTLERQERFSLSPLWSDRNASPRYTLERQERYIYERHERFSVYTLERQERFSLYTLERQERFSLYLSTLLGDRID